MAKTLFPFEPTWKEDLDWSLSKDVSVLSGKKGREHRISRFRNVDFVRTYDINYSSFSNIQSSALENKLAEGLGQSFLVPNSFEVFSRLDFGVLGSIIVADDKNFTEHVFSPLAKGDLTAIPHGSLPSAFQVNGDWNVIRWREGSFVTTLEQRKIVAWNNLLGALTLFVEGAVWQNAYSALEQRFAFLDECQIISIDKTAKSDSVFEYKVTWRSMNQ